MVDIDRAAASTSCEFSTIERSVLDGRRKTGAIHPGCPPRCLACRIGAGYNAKQGKIIRAPTGIAVESETIHRLLKATPFQAFRLFLSNGLTYDVRHPELALVGKRDMLIGSPASGYTHPTFESFDIVSLLHINGVQLVPVSGTSNGPLK